MAPVSTASTCAFGVALKRVRRAAHLTRAQLAERAGFSVVYISMLERGALESAAQTLDTARRPRGEDTSGLPHLPVGRFLGALPARLLVGRERELAVVDEALAICERLGEGLQRKYIERDLATLNRSTGLARP